MYANKYHFSSPILEKYKIKGRPKESMYNYNTNTNLFQIKRKSTNDVTIGISPFSQEKSEKRDKKLSLKEDGKKDEFKLDTPVEKFNRRGSQVVVLKKNKKLFKEAKEKININNIKNLDGDTQSILEKDKCNEIKFKLKLTKDKIQSYMMDSIQKSSEKTVPEDITAAKLLSHDGLFQAKKNNVGMCHLSINQKGQDKSSKDNNISLYSNSKDEDDDDSGSHNFCLSMYYQGNLKRLNESSPSDSKYFGYNIATKRNLKESKIRFNKLHKTYNLVDLSFVSSTNPTK